MSRGPVLASSVRPAVWLTALLFAAPALGAQSATGGVRGHTAVGAPAAVPLYSVRFVGPGTPSAVNDLGQVVGNAGGRAWFADADDVPVELPLPAGATSSVANDINDLAWVVGQASGVGFGAKGVIWKPDGGGGWTTTLLPSPNDSEATAVNDLGDVIGYVVGGGTHYYNDTEGLVALFPFGVTAWPADINNERVLAGRDFFGQGQTVDLDTLVVTEVGLPFGTGTNYMALDLNGINDAGDLCGRGVVATSLPDDDQAVRLDADAGRWRALNNPYPYAAGIDLDGAGNTLFSVGFSSPVYVFRPGSGTFDVNTLLAPGSQDWFVGLSTGGEISDDGLIVCTGGNAVTSQSGVVVLTPR